MKNSTAFFLKVFLFISILPAEASEKLSSIFKTPEKPMKISGQYWLRYGGVDKIPYSLKGLTKKQIEKSKTGSLSLYSQLAVIYNNEKGANKVLAQKYFVDSVRPLLSMDFSKNGTTYLISRTKVIENTLFMSKVLKKAKLYNKLVDKLIMRNKFLDVKEPILNMDWARDRIPPCWALVANMDDSELKTDLLKKLQYATSKVFKRILTPDGGGIHHNCDHLSYSSYSMLPLAELAVKVHGTKYRLSNDAINNLKAFAKAKALSSIGLKIPGNLTARASLEPFYFKTLPNILLTLYELDDIEGNKTSEMMDLFLSLSGRHDGWKKSWFEKGFVSKEISAHATFNISSSAVHRRNSWLVSVNGNRAPFKGIEMYANPGSPRSYMKNSCLGFIQIYNGKYSKRLFGYSKNGWDYNHFPGVTSTPVPLHMLMSTRYTSQVRNNSYFSQGTSLGGNGMWAMIVKGQREVCRKSVMFFDNRVTVLTSNILKNGNSNPHTTLFQYTLKDKQEPIYLGTKAIFQFPYEFKRNLLGNVPLRDNFNNCYYIHRSRGSSLVLSRKQQSSLYFSKISKDAPAKLRKKPQNVKREEAEKYLKYCIPQVGNFTKAFVEHTQAVSSFAYTVFVDSKYPRSLPYKIIRLDKEIHIFHDIPNKTVCYSLFEKDFTHKNSFISSSSHPLTVMVKNEGNSLKCSLTVTNHQYDTYYQGKIANVPKPTELLLKINGLYELTDSHGSDISADYESGKTILKVSCKNYMPVIFKVRRKN